MAWVTPKTDWKVEIVDGEYLGDYFNATDFNRIKNNLEHLKQLAVSLFKDFSITSLGADRTFVSFVYADEINILEDNFNTINANTLKRPYGDSPVYLENEIIMDCAELNRLESAMLDLYNKLNNTFDGRRTLTFNFGIKEGL